MNPHVKRRVKLKTFNDILTKAKLSPITINLISEFTVRAKWLLWIPVFASWDVSIVKYYLDTLMLLDVVIQTYDNIGIPC